VPDDRDAARDSLRDDAARAADHAGIDRLIDGLVPALVAKLGTLDVGELEVREDDWKVRLRRPAGAGATYGRRATDRGAGRSHPGVETLGAPAHGRPVHPASAHPGQGGGAGPALAAVGPGREDGSHGAEGPAGSDGHGPAAGGAQATRHVATSPAVGVFQPGPKAVGGTRVRAGERLGVVDMLGIPQDVVAPADGIVIGVVVEGGTAVEYGQELVHVEPAGAAEAR
jgi:biotin carboxyl carrier protein